VGWGSLGSVVIQVMSDTAIGPGCLKPVLGASRGGGAPAGVPHRGSRGGSSRGDRRHRCPPLRQRAHMGGSSSLGMSPEKKSLIFLPMSPIGLSSAWLGERGWWGMRVRLCLATSRNGALGHWGIGALGRRRRWRVGPKVLRSCGGRARSAMGMRSGCTRANARPLGSSSLQARAPRRKCAGWPRRLSRVGQVRRCAVCGTPTLTPGRYASGTSALGRASRHGRTGQG